MPQPPPDFPAPDWDREPPPEEPGASDQLPQPRSRWYGTEHLPGPEPCAPVWHGEPPDDDPYPAHPPDRQGTRTPTTSSDGSGLRFDLPRLVDYLTTTGLKPVPPRVVMHVHLTDQTLFTGQGVVRSDDSGPMLLTQLVELLGRHSCTISLRPVLDPANLAAVDAYEIPRDSAATPSGPGIRRRCSRSPAGPGSTCSWTTPCRTTTPLNPPARPVSPTSDRWPCPSTGPRPPASGTSNNPTPACTCGAARTATTSSSPTTAPKPSDPCPAADPIDPDDRSESRSADAIASRPSASRTRLARVTLTGSAGRRWAPRGCGEGCPGRSTRTRSRPPRLRRRTRT